MYPFNTQQMWAENQWYVAAFTHEVNRDILARTILNNKMVLYRDQTGVAHALSGICPHRMMPMERGELEGDTIVCGYHGLTFDTRGRCVATPTSSKLANCKLRSFPLKEEGPLLWVWPGDPDKALTTPLPNQAAAGIGLDGWHTDCVQKISLQSRYQLLIDNLFDLSHLGFIHGSIVGKGGISVLEPQIEEREGRLVIARLQENVPVDDYHRFLHPNIDAMMSVRVDTDLIGVSLLNAGSQAWNGKPVDENLLGHVNFIHGITPETPNTTHYFSIVTRDFRQNDEALAAALKAQNQAVIQQDVEALEEIERLLTSGVALPREISIGSDTGAIRARRYFSKLVDSE